ncbi:hypothetical protein GC169_00235 [bacterium]|nr:hypothetical protein [bacterium]
MAHLLIPFCDRPDGPAISITAEGWLGSDGAARFSFRVSGDVDRIKTPPAEEPRRRDGLWRRTCFEVFLARPGEAAYLEINLSPSGAWAVYRFAAYRKGMEDAGEVSEVSAALAKAGHEMALEASVDLAAVAMFADAPELEAAYTAVIEDVDGRVSHWALAHPGPAADFHLRGGFKARLTRGEAA